MALFCLNAHAQRPPGHRCVSYKSNDEEMRLGKARAHPGRVPGSPSATGMGKLPDSVPGHGGMDRVWSMDSSKAVIA